MALDILLISMCLNVLTDLGVDNILRFFTGSLTNDVMSELVQCS